MAPLADVIKRLDELLSPQDYEDFGPNGVQISSSRDVVKVVTGVSATRAFIERGIELGGDLLLVHHGVFWGSSMGLDPMVAERIRPLFRSDVALAAYHLPLDAHPEVGNNALLAERLGASAHEPFAGIGRLARVDLGIDELLARVREVTGGREPLHLPGGRGRVERLAIVSGGGAPYLAAAAEAGADAFLTGEPKEQVMGEAAELGIHFIAGGHYATETFGVRALGELLERELGLDHVFADLPNPV